MFIKAEKKGTMGVNPGTCNPEFWKFNIKCKFKNIFYMMFPLATGKLHLYQEISPFFVCLFK